MEERERNRCFFSFLWRQERFIDVVVAHSWTPKDNARVKQRIINFWKETFTLQSQTQTFLLPSPQRQWRCWSSITASSDPERSLPLPSFSGAFLLLLLLRLWIRELTWSNRLGWTMIKRVYLWVGNPVIEMSSGCSSVAQVSERVPTLLVSRISSAFHILPPVILFVRSYLPLVLRSDRV